MDKNDASFLLYFRHLFQTRLILSGASNYIYQYLIVDPRYFISRDKSDGNDRAEKINFKGTRTEMVFVLSDEFFLEKNL